MDEATDPDAGCKECGRSLGSPRRSDKLYCSATCRAKAKEKRARADGRYEQELARSSAKNRARREANARPCPYCGEPMLNPRRVQCGAPECKRLWTNERMLAYQRDYKARTGHYKSREYRYERICEVCGKTWQAERSTQRHCSIGCANKARAYETVCETCGKTWSAKQITARWCSEACRWEASRPKPGTEVALWRPRPWWMRRVQVIKLSQRRWYAGRCKRCDAPFISDQPENRYCSRVCGRSDAKARRRARKKDAYVSDVYRARIFDRDKWTCRLCHRKVNRQAVVPHPNAPVLDHIIPLDAGGTHEPANVQCAHFLCNSIKGARGGGEQLMLIG